MKIAVFDVCGTLYNANTTFAFLDDYFSANKKYLFFRKVSNFFVVKVLNHYIYKYFKTDMIRVVATSFLKGEKVESVASYSQDFVHQKLQNKIKQNIYKKLKQYKEENYTIVLMSGSYEFIIKDVLDYVGADYFFASKLKVNNGIYEGQYEEDILLSKVEILKDKFPNISELIVVSDNKTDLNLMLVANKAFAICNKKKHCSFWKKNMNKKIEVLKDYV